MKGYDKQPQGEVSEQVPAVDPELVTDEGSLNDQETQVAEDEAFEDQPVPEVEQAQRSWLARPTRQQVLASLPFWGILLLAAILRFWGLGDKPLHHDESLHAYYALHLLYNLEDWAGCFAPQASCYHYDPLLHGPFQFHFIALVYKISQLLGAPDNGVNTTTVRILAATLGTAMVGLPYFLRDYLSRTGAWLACLLLAVSPSLVYFSRFAREDIYMAFFTLLLVVALARYVRERRARWLVIAGLAFAFSYATKEATFLTVAVFGSFAGGLLVWEVGVRLPLRTLAQRNQQFLPRTWAPVLLLMYAVVMGIIAKVVLGWVHELSIYIPAHQQASDATIALIKERTVLIVPWLGIALGLFMLFILGREVFGKLPEPGRHGLARRVDPQQQPLLDTLLTMPWTHWLFALIAGIVVFFLLFTVLFTNVAGGIGDGIWQGLYYWIQQQQVARGGQPWYYYLLLIPLYEQIGVVFGLAGIVYCLLRPTRFRLFLAYWCVGNMVIYSWAGEKMPWLTIHITMPLMLVAAIALRPLVMTLWNVISARWQRASTPPDLLSSEPGALPARPVSNWRVGGAVLGLLVAVLLLIPTLNNMYQLTYLHAADGPHEMMIYVQTTPDVNTVMARVDALDQKLYHGSHQLPVGLTSDATWPMIWYLRDYPNTCLDYPTGCTQTAKNIPIIISGGDDPYATEALYSGKNGHYVFQEYHMRDQWDQGYMPPPCQPAQGQTCGPQPYVGVGPWLWLSYGDNPPKGATFNFGLAAQRIWQWWWHRQAFGDTTGSYKMVLFIRSDLGIKP